ncbi:MAG TPA: hypothetical protein VFP39_09070 [Gemmatimonadales bacterium]|nr:hypothetical protein [Gemmatimonadales bacterium]
MTSLGETSAPSWLRIGRAIEDRLQPLRGIAFAHPAMVVELMRERVGHPVETDHRPHLVAALEWLARAQDASGGNGLARGYSLTWNAYFRSRGWQPPYPETTGYIIASLHMAARRLDRLDLKRRAERAALWEIDVALPSGAVQGGVVGEGQTPAVFNTGQVLLGWMATLAASGGNRFADAAYRAGNFLVSCLDQDGLWHRGNSHFADAHATLYNARTAWALAEAGTRLGVPDFVAAAARNLTAVVKRQHDDGWFPNCCLTDPERPLLHTIAYTIRGLLEGGRVLRDSLLIDHAALAATRIAEAQTARGRLPGRFARRWRPAARWSCLTGEAQMANIWLRLFEITGLRHWRAPAEVALRWLKSTQNRTSTDPGLRGGIKGSFPCSGPYGRYQTLSWATKFFADALMRSEQATDGNGQRDAADCLA